MGPSPYTLFVLRWAKGASGAKRRAASSRFMVPTALTSKSSKGREAARSWLGWAAQWMMKSGRTASTSASTPARSRMSRAWWVNWRVIACSRRRFQVVSPSGPKNSRRMLLSTPWTVQPCASKWVTLSEPIRPLLPVTSNFFIVVSLRV